MKKAISSIVSAAFLLSIPAAVYAQSCVNCWINPNTGELENLDRLVQPQTTTSPAAPASQTNQTAGNNAAAPANRVGSNSTAAVIVYGRPTCGLTTGMMRQLDANKIAYQFKNIDEEPVNEEMWGLIRKSGNSGTNSITLPVLSVKGKTLINSSIEEVKASLR